MRRTDAARAAAALACALLCVPAARADGPALSLRVTQGLWAGALRDGTVLAQVRLGYPESHCGLLVWSEAPVVNGQPGRYALAGKNAPGQTLRVRLTGRDWRPDTTGGKGMVLDGGEASATLEVVADGDQAVRAEIWPLSLQAAATGCR
ncbi:AfaD family invasin [Yokenella regensburgei]|uniref:AfaD family invasin n=1 Tax=Yokenella regensburgei TaxID=158877 RepID=UPI001375F228|nr:AfaD family invasin [Yokenella regensburgei]KAF1366569.1 hypothetical protein FHR25_004970 [Yokenella regensburgei]